MSDIQIQKLRQVDFTLLLVFDEIIRRGRAADAAERLGLSQPAISHALGRLRHLTGDRLFERHPGGLRPTARARDLAPLVAELLNLGGRALSSGPDFDPEHCARTFRISAADLAATLLTSNLVRRLRCKAPEARVAITFPGGSDGAITALRRGDLDVATGRWDEVPEDCAATPMFSEGYRVIARPGHPALAGGLDLPAYLAADHMIVSFSGQLRGTIDAALDRIGLTRRVVAAVPMFLSAFAAVSTSDLVATTPTRLADRFAERFGLVAYDLPFAADPFVIEALVARRALPDPAVAWLLDEIRGALSDAG